MILKDFRTKIHPRLAATGDFDDVSYEKLCKDYFNWHAKTYGFPAKVEEYTGEVTYHINLEESAALFYEAQCSDFCSWLEQRAKGDTND